MFDFTNPRTRLAAVAVFCLLALLASGIAQGWQQAIRSPVLAFFLKLGFLTFALWLAWPNLVQILQKLPPQFPLLSIVSMAVFLTQPRIGLFFFLGLAAYYFLWRVYVVVFRGKR